MLRLVTAILAVLAVWNWALAPAYAEKRLALVIGNDAYATVPALQKAVNDAQAVGDTVAGLGFEVIRASNVTRREMNLKLQEFSSRIEPGDVAMVFYAGHGVEIEGQNYLLPVDVPAAQPGQEEFVKGEAISFDAVLGMLRGRGAGLNIIILDACRNNPFASKAGRSLGGSRGLARVQAPSGTFIMYSADAGEEALDRLGDNDGNPNSVFTRTLLPLMKRPGLDLVSAAREARREVRRVAAAVSHNQTPAYYDSVLGEFYFTVAITGEAPAPPAPAPLADPVAADYQMAERIGTAEAWEAFLGRHGATTGFHVDLAKAARKKLALVVPAPPKIEPDKTECDGVMVASTGGGAEKCLKPGDEFTDCEGCPKMVVIPAGSFTMGSPESEKDGLEHERPQRKMKIGRAFAAGKFEVTRGQFAAFAADSGRVMGNKCWIFLKKLKWVETSDRSFRKPGHEQTDDHPAVCVSWEDAQAYVKWLSRKTGATYRLLSEAEWEYGARAGSRSRFSFGDANNQLCDAGNGADATARAKFPAWDLSNSCTDGYVYTAPVGTFAANDFGLADMHGNVWEWTEDCWHNLWETTLDQAAWTAGDCDYRVYRGGGWPNAPGRLRSAARSRESRGDRTDSVGFRVAKTLTP